MADGAGLSPFYKGEGGAEVSARRRPKRGRTDPEGCAHKVHDHLRDEVLDRLPDDVQVGLDEGLDEVRLHLLAHCQLRAALGRRL